jgi:hypothetical protein
LVVGRQCPRVQAADQFQRPRVSLAPAFSPLVGEKVERASHDNASPVERPFDFIHLERDPRMVPYRRKLRAFGGPTPEIAVSEHIGDRFDVHAIVKCERQSSDMMPSQECDRVLARRLEKLRQFRSHNGLPCHST